MPHVLDQSEEAIQRFMQLTGWTRERLEQSRAQGEATWAKHQARDKSHDQEIVNGKMQGPLAFDIIGEDGQAEGGDNTG